MRCIFNHLYLSYATIWLIPHATFDFNLFFCIPFLSFILFVVVRWSEGSFFLSVGSVVPMIIRLLTVLCALALLRVYDYTHMSSADFLSEDCSSAFFRLMMFGTIRFSQILHGSSNVYVCICEYTTYQFQMGLTDTCARDEHSIILVPTPYHQLDVWCRKFRI